MLLVSPTECWHLHVLSIGLVTMLMTTRVKLSISCKNIKKIFMVFDTCLIQFKSSCFCFKHYLCAAVLFVHKPTLNMVWYVLRFPVLSWIYILYSVWMSHILWVIEKIYVAILPLQCNSYAGPIFFKIYS